MPWWTWLLISVVLALLYLLALALVVVAGRADEMRGYK